MAATTNPTRPAAGPAQALHVNSSSQEAAARHATSPPIGLKLGNVRSGVANVNDSSLAASAHLERLLDHLEDADLARQARDFAHAEELYRLVMTELSELGVAPVPRGRALAGLAVCSDFAGRKEEAIGYYEQAIGIYENLESSAHWATHTALLNNLAILYRSLDRPVDAEACYVRAINKHESMNDQGFGEQIIMLYANLACLYYKLGLFEPAISIGTRALELREREVCPDITRHFELLRSLGIFYILGGHVNEGIDLLERAYDVVRKIIPPDHEATIELLVNLGSAYMTAGRRKEALTIFEEAARLQTLLRGSKDLLLAHIHTNIGYLNFCDSRNDRAYESHRRALQILNENTAAGDAERAEANHNLATVCEAMNRKQQAAAHRKTAMELLTSVAEDTKEKIAIATRQNEPLPINSASLVNSDRLFVRMPVSVEAPRRAAGRLIPPLRTETIEFDL